MINLIEVWSKFSSNTYPKLFGNDLNKSQKWHYESKTVTILKNKNSLPGISFDSLSAVDIKAKWKMKISFVVISVATKQFINNKLKDVSIYLPTTTTAEF